MDILSFPLNRFSPDQPLAVTDVQATDVFFVFLTICRVQLTGDVTGPDAGAERQSANTSQNFYESKRALAKAAVRLFV